MACIDMHYYPSDLYVKYRGNGDMHNHNEHTGKYNSDLLEVISVISHDIIKGQMFIIKKI